MNTINRGYSNNSRTDLTREILKFDVQNIVEFGSYDCSTLAHLDTVLESVKLYGVDIDEYALSKCQNPRIKKIIDDLNKPDSKKYSEFTKSDEKFLILLLDVIEHLDNPENFMAWVKATFPIGSFIIISVPNVRNWRVFYALLTNNWPMNESGIFDKTHRHFFTSKSIIQRLSPYGNVVKLQFRYSRKWWLQIFQNLAPSILCGQITVTISTNN